MIRSSSPSKVSIKVEGVEVEIKGFADDGFVIVKSGKVRLDTPSRESREICEIPEAAHGSGANFLGTRSLRFDMREAYELGVKGHPQLVMAKLGISYTHATPQSMGDQWWFWNCTGGLAVLPEFLSALNLDPRECVGYGLSKNEADEISTIALARGSL